MKRIAIIEDNKSNRKLMTDVLSMAGYKIVEAESADVGIEMIRTEMPDLVLMDINLPGTDGVTAMLKLKKDSKTSHIPIIAVTANAMMGDEEKLIADGFDAYIGKPFRYKQALETIAKVLA